jgi:hypothetical protein
MDQQKIFSLIMKIIIYITILKVIFWSIENEKVDILCPDGPFTKNKCDCKQANGKLYANHKYKQGDTLNTIISNLEKINQNSRREVIWRRYLICSVASTLLLFLITQQRFPNEIELIGSVLVIYSILCMMHGFYSYHHYNFCSDTVNMNLKMLRHKLKKIVKT